MNWSPWIREEWQALYQREPRESIETVLARHEMTDEAPGGDPRRLSLEHLPDPFLFRDMARAVALIADVIERSGRILIYGDYDADGLSASALLGRFLRELGADYEVLIPDRLQDGYGFSEATAQRVIELAPELMITVDCGISAAAEIKMIREAGIDCIITDHHKCPAELPASVLILNPHCPGETYPFPYLAGVAVAFNLVWALATYLEKIDFDVERYLTLVAVGTVADAMPLAPVNRILVAAGLSQFRQKAPLGLRLLAEKMASSDELDARFIGFSIAPRLNAAGRFGQIEPALRLLFTEDLSEAERCIFELEEMNNERRKLESEIFKEATELMLSDPELSRSDLICLDSDHWHLGVVGIVAARLSENINKPVFLASLADNGIYRGSARAPEGYHLVDILSENAAYLETFGGHAGAAGFTFQAGQKDELKRALQKTEVDLKARPSQTYLCRLEAPEICDETVHLIESYGPYGQEHEELVFCLSSVTVSHLRPLSGGRHLSLDIILNNGALLKGIAFVRGRLYQLLREGDIVDIYGHLVFNDFRGRRNIQFKILDLALRGEEERQEAFAAQEALYEAGHSLVEIEQELGVSLPRLKAELFKDFYRFIEDHLKYPEAVDLTRLRKLYNWYWREDYPEFIFARLLALFREADLMLARPLATGRYYIGLREASGERVKLSQTTVWQEYENLGLFDAAEG